MPTQVEPLLTINEVMTILRVSRSTVDRLRRAGHLEAAKIGGQVRFSVNSVRDVAAQGCPVPPSRPAASRPTVAGASPQQDSGAALDGFQAIYKIADPTPKGGSQATHRLQ